MARTAVKSFYKYGDEEDLQPPPALSQQPTAKAPAYSRSRNEAPDAPEPAYGPPQGGPRGPASGAPVFRPAAPLGQLPAGTPEQVQTGMGFGLPLAPPKQEAAPKPAPRSASPDNGPAPAYDYVVPNQGNSVGWNVFGPAPEVEAWQRPPKPNFPNNLVGRSKEAWWEDRQNQKAALANYPRVAPEAKLNNMSIDAYLDAVLDNKPLAHLPADWTPDVSATAGGIPTGWPDPETKPEFENNLMGNALEAVWDYQNGETQAALQDALDASNSQQEDTATDATLNTPIPELDTGLGEDDGEPGAGTTTTGATDAADTTDTAGATEATGEPAPPDPGFDDQLSFDQQEILRLLGDTEAIDTSEPAALTIDQFRDPNEGEWKTQYEQSLAAQDAGLDATMSEAEREQARQARLASELNAQLGRGAGGGLAGLQAQVALGGMSERNKARQEYADDVSGIRQEYGGRLQAAEEAAKGRLTEAEQAERNRRLAVWNTKFQARENRLGQLVQLAAKEKDNELYVWASKLDSYNKRLDRAIAQAENSKNRELTVTLKKFDAQVLQWEKQFDSARRDKDLKKMAELQELMADRESTAQMIESLIASGDSDGARQLAESFLD